METYHSKIIVCFIWGYCFISWRRSNGKLWIHTAETSWWRTTDVFYLTLVWDVVETYWWGVVVTCSWDVITTFEDVPLKRLGSVPPRHSLVFCLICTCDVAVTYRETSLRHPHNMLLLGGIGKITEQSWPSLQWLFWWQFQAQQKAIMWVLMERWLIMGYSLINETCKSSSGAVKARQSFSKFSLIKSRRNYQKRNF